MKVLAAGALIAVIATTGAARAEHISWLLTGTNPDVYAPAAAQPAGHDFFHRPGCSPERFLKPCVGVPFAVLRQMESANAASADASLTSARRAFSAFDVSRR